MSVAWILSLVFAAVIGAIANAEYNRRHRRNFPTLQEQLDVIARTATPATAEDLVRLMTEGRVVTGSGGAKFRLSHEVNGVLIQTPFRDHLGLVLPDIPGFVAVVAEAQAQSH